MSVEFLHLGILRAAISIITRTQLHKESAGATPRTHAAGLALEEIKPIGVCTNWIRSQIQLVPLVDFQTIHGTVVPPLVDWGCAQMK